MKEFSKNIEKFLSKIPRSPRWRFFTEQKEIRICGGGMFWCPITYVVFQETGETFPNSQFANAGRKLGLTKEESEKIVSAVDGRTKGPLRTRILEACGLEEA